MFPIIRIPCQWQKSILFILKCLHSHSDVILHMSHWGRSGKGCGVSVRGPEWAPAIFRLKSWAVGESLSSGNLWTEKFYTIPQKFEILCSGKGVSSWQILSSLFQILKRKQKEKEKLESYLQAWEHFHFAVIPLTPPCWQIFTTGFNQQAPGDSNVHEGLHS